MSNYFIGLMSGTSIDGIDAVLVDFSNGNSKIIESYTQDYDKEFKEQLHSLCTPSDNEIQKLGEARVKLAEFEAKAVDGVLKKSNIKASQIVAIGSHGQTIRHRPDCSFSIQLDDGARLAALTNIDVVCDFRSADIANGGQGAPLTQAFHRMQFASNNEVSIVLNLGGIANLTVIDKDENHTIIDAFDCGPANTLIDTACRMLLNIPYDKDGQIAKKGHIMPKILANYLDTPYLQLPSPKSTGRETFNADFIKDELLLCATHNDLIPSFLNTLTEFTVISAVNAIRAIIYKNKIPKVRLILCGGGAYNSFMKEKFVKHLSMNNTDVMLADDLCVNSKLIEAHAFAYFAYKFTKREPLDLGNSTGAKRASILGCLYPAIK